MIKSLLKDSEFYMVTENGPGSTGPEGIKKFCEYLLCNDKLVSTIVTDVLTKNLDATTDSKNISI